MTGTVLREMRDGFCLPFVFLALISVRGFIESPSADFFWDGESDGDGRANKADQGPFGCGI